MSQSSSRSILLVDDDQIILDTLGYGLQMSSYIVTQCGSARDALEQYTSSPPDLAIIDIGLPDMRGTELAEQLLLYRYRPILILSSHSEPEWIDRAIGSGAIGYLVKPLTPSQLIPSIETALARFGDINQSIAGNFAKGDISESQLRAAMDQFSFGIVIIDQDRRIILCNSVGHRFLSDARLLRNASGKLKTAVRNDQLTALLDQSLGEINGHSAPAAFCMHDDIHEKTIQIWATPLHVPGSGTEQTAIVIINDSSLNTAVPSFLFKSLYGFTEKECKLAHALTNGMSINQYCEKVFVTPNTARTHLKSIYRKTSTNRQAELICLLSRLYINLTDGNGED
jgi:DNA-binding NarL/FixJ family response regulator